MLRELESIDSFLCAVREYAKEHKLKNIEVEAEVSINRLHRVYQWLQERDKQEILTTIKLLGGL